MSFAIKLLQREVTLEQCTPLFNDPKYAENLKQLQELIAPLLSAMQTLIQIDEDKCIGCGNCVIACPANVAIEPAVAKGINPRTTDVVFTVEDGKIKMLNLDKCRRNPPHRLNCNICEIVCYSEAIKVIA
jgi:4Fe-4S ferredoxin